MKITATPDFTALAAIHSRCFTQGWSAQAFADLFSVNGTQALLAQGNKGFGIVRILGEEAEIITLAVLPEHQKQGIGKAVTKAMLRLAEGQGVKSVFLEARKSNEAAQALYANAGFEIISMRKDYYSNPAGSSEDAVIMRRSL
jgi:ribosomal-protein-alanine N-acetyltransferase